MKLIKLTTGKKKADELAEDLETMYRRAVELESQSGPSPWEEAQRHYRTLKLDPSATPEEVRQSYEHLSRVWDPDRFTDNPEWRKRAGEKRAEIRDAYENILAFQEGEIADQPKDIDPYGPASPAPLPGGKFSWRRARVLIVVGLAALLFALFVWPTPYDRDSVNWGGRTYPVRTNRLTGKASYFNGEKWNPMSRISTESLSGLSAAPETPAVKTFDAVPPPLRDGRPAKGIPSAEPLTAAAMGEKPYAIQIGALRDGEKAAVLVNDLRKKGVPVRLLPVMIKDQGLWYRILMGNFDTKEEALQYLENKKVSAAYPGSFVQKAFP